MYNPAPPATLICTFLKCFIFIQVLQLSVSAPLLADFPVGDKHMFMLLEAPCKLADEKDEEGEERRGEGRKGGREGGRG